MEESNKMKDMPVNKLMVQMGISLIWWAFPVTEIISCFAGYLFLKKIRKEVAKQLGYDRCEKIIMECCRYS